MSPVICSERVIELLTIQTARIVRDVLPVGLQSTTHPRTFASNDDVVTLIYDSSHRVGDLRANQYRPSPHPEQRQGHVRQPHRRPQE